MRLWLPLALLALPLLVACGDDDESSRGGNRGSLLCTPGKAEDCTCPGGSVSSQSCASDGLSYGACACDPHVTDGTGGASGLGGGGGASGAAGAPACHALGDSCDDGTACCEGLKCAHAEGGNVCIKG